MDKLLKIINLKLGFYNDSIYNEVIKGIDLSLDNGEILGIVGESGSGKTLSAMSIINLLPDNAKIVDGKIIFEGENLLNIPKNKMSLYRGKKISLIPQDPMTSLNPLYTVGNQLYEVIKLHNPGITKHDMYKIAVDSLKQVHIYNPEDRLNAYPHQLSGGMKQRIIIASALIANSKLIIADEPTTALDVTVQSQIIQLLQEVRDKFNTSIILITHDLALVEESTDYVCVMYSGKIVEKAKTDELFKNPKHPYTKALFDAIPALNSKKLKVIQGSVPSIYENICGCTFNLRCNYAFKPCFNIFPEPKNINYNHEVMCHLYNNEI